MRRYTIWFSMLLLLTAAVPRQASAQGQQEPIKTTMAAFAGTFASFVAYVAQDLGLFKKHGLDVSMIYGTGSQVTTDLLSGSTDFATFSIEHAVQVAEKGQHLKVLAVLETSVPFTIIVRKQVPTPDAGKWPQAMHDLKGLKIAVSTRGAGSDNMLRYLLKQAGMDPDKDVTILPVGDPVAQIAALNAGQVDAAMAFEPTQTVGDIALKITKPLLDLEGGQGPKVLQPYAYEGLSARADFIQKNPDTVKRVVAAIVDAERIIGDPAKLETIVGVAAKNMKGLDTAALRQYLEKYAKIYADPVASRKAIANVNAMLLGTGTIKASVPYEAVVDEHYLPHAR